MADDVLLIPVGHDLGVHYLDGLERRQQIRIGADLAELSDEEFAVWLLAHGIDDEDRPTPASLVATAESLELPTATITAAVERLTKLGLLAQVEPGGGSAVLFARRHQLFPLMLGLGPDQDEPWLQTVGPLHRPVAKVSSALYDVWAWAHLAPHLWSGCEDAAEAARVAGVTAADELDPRKVLAGLLGSVHAMLSVRAAYFDREGL
ncbi:hypothetical protein [Kribbella sp. NPDC055071]